MCPNEKTMWDHLACRNVNPKKRNLQECLQHYHAFFWLATISFLVYLRRCGLYTYTFVCVHSFIQQAFIECPLCVRHCVRWFWHSKVSQSGRKKNNKTLLPGSLELPWLGFLIQLFLIILPTIIFTHGRKADLSVCCTPSSFLPLCCCSTYADFSFSNSHLLVFKASSWNLPWVI